jgi:serine/threonine protein kinase
MIKRRKRLTEPEAALFMRQLLDAVLYLHENCVIHRDLKLGNLFLDRNINIKVGDFGLATKLENADEKRKTICGTPNYIAPEVIQGDKATRGHSFEVDIWSMGVILFTVLVGKPPYEAKDVKATYQRIIANEYSFPSHIPVSDQAKDLIVSMLQSKPEDRPSLQQISNHEFLASHSLPLSLPLNATHSAPEWTTNGYGDIVAANNSPSEDKYSVKLSKKPSIPRGNSQRRPLGYRDPNVEANGYGPDRLGSKKEMTDRDVARGNGLPASGNKNVRASSSNTPSSSPFQIYDETTESRTPRVQSISKGSFSSRPSPTSADELVVKTNALSMRAVGARPDFPRSQSVVSAVSSAATSAAGGTTVAIENDANILNQMLDNLESVMGVTDSRKGMYHASSPRPVHRGGPNKWVTRYVDYTSKYGLGFLLNDGR